MLTGHSGNRSSRDKRGFYDATLLLPCSSQPFQGSGRCLNCIRIAHKVSVGQKNPAVYTAKSGRLPFWWGEESYFRYRAKGSSLYPYVCLTIPRWASGQELKPFIERVVVGPTPNLKLSLAAVTSFLRTQGLDHAEVKKSEIPFRDW